MVGRSDHTFPNQASQSSLPLLSAHSFAINCQLALHDPAEEGNFARMWVGHIAQFLIMNPNQ